MIAPLQSGYGLSPPRLQGQRAIVARAVRSRFSGPRFDKGLLASGHVGMTFLHQHSRSIEALLALIVFFLGAYALRLRKAELPLHIWSLSVSTDAQPFGYWFGGGGTLRQRLNWTLTAGTQNRRGWPRDSEQPLQDLVLLYFRVSRWLTITQLRVVTLKLVFGLGNRGTSTLTSALAPRSTPATGASHPPFASIPPPQTQRRPRQPNDSAKGITA
jgi:hypothetical protein